MHDGCAQGLAQMEALRRAEPFVNEGYSDIKEYALCFYKKDCMIRKAQQPKPHEKRKKLKIGKQMQINPRKAADLLGCLARVKAFARRCLTRHEK